MLKPFASKSKQLLTRWTKDRHGCANIALHDNNASRARLGSNIFLTQTERKQHRALGEFLCTLMDKNCRKKSEKREFD